MMRFKFFSFLCLLFMTSQWTLGQNQKTNIYGTIVEKQTKEPLEQVTVRLLQSKDSSFVAGTISIKKGSFTIKNIKSGNYILHITYVGYNDVYQNISVLPKNQKEGLNLCKIELTETSVLLGTTVVTGKAPEVVLRNDTLEYNADSYKAAEGSVLEDVLKKMPGIEISTEGKITVNGKEIKKVMVDGKEFFSSDPKVASKNLPSKMIDKVQILDKKSDMAMMTGFDDGNEETIINLTVKKGMKKGTFGNVMGGYGSKNRYEAVGMVNRFLDNDRYTVMGNVNNTNNMGFNDLSSSVIPRMGGGMRRGFSGGSGNGITMSGLGGININKECNKKLSINGAIQYSHSDNTAKSRSSQTNVLTNGTSYYNEQNSSNSKSDGLSSNLRFEWKPDSLTQLLFRPNFTYNKNRANRYETFNTLNEELDTVNIGKSAYTSIGEGKRFNATLEFSRKLNNKGRVFSASVSGGLNDSYNRGNNYSKTEYYLKNPTTKNDLIDQLFRLDNKGNNSGANITWVEPLGRNNFIQVSYNVNYSKSESLKNSYRPDNDGHYNVLDSAYSQSYRNIFVNQRASIAFKSQREKFNYTIGFNVDPSYSKSVNFVGDSVLSSLSRKVVNLSPSVQFRYRFSRESNLRIDYRGSTNQPSINQLQPVADLSDPLNVTIGNPDLKPIYNNNVSISYHNFNRHRQQALIISGNGGYIVNDIVRKSVYDRETGKQTSTYENVNGNYNLRTFVMFNSPFINKHFSLNTATNLSFNNQHTFINGEKNLNKNFNINENLGLRFQSDIVDLGVTGRFSYMSSVNSLQSTNNQKVFNYGVGGNTTIYLPLQFRIESDINWSANSGYTNGFSQNEILWNASASKSFLKSNQATIRFKIYDILKQRSNISRSISGNTTTDREYNTLTSYFMFHFIYRFSIFSKGSNSKFNGPGNMPGKGFMPGGGHGGNRGFKPHS